MTLIQLKSDIDKLNLEQLKDIQEYVSNRIGIKLFDSIPSAQCPPGHEYDDYGHIRPKRSW